jgi:protein-disulfide isomerase
MSTRPSRGRAVQAKQGSSALRTFYIILAVVAIAGLAALATMVLRSRQQAAIAPGASLSRPPLTAPTGVTPEGYYYKGRPDAPVTVVEYSDFQCPFCARFANGPALEIDRDYVETGKIKYVFHDYPLQQHPNAVPAAEAARCAGDQNAFWPMHDLLFANQAQWANNPQPAAQFAAYAGQLGLDRAVFESCMASHKHLPAIERARQEGDRLQIPGTPTFAVDGKLIDANVLRMEIDAALQAQR